MTDPPVEDDLPRACRRARAVLPGLVAGHDWPPGLRGRFVRRHLARCQDCAAELDRQRRLAEGLVEVTASPAGGDADQEPPEGLLDSLLEQAAQPGVRGRVAVPMRGAVSGARPSYTVALLLTAFLAGLAVGWVTWRLGRALTRR